MRVFVTGDTHGEVDFHKLTTKNFPIQKELTKKDLVIICGDAGVCWSGKKDRWIQDWYNERNFTTFSVLGNHENYDIIENLPIVNFMGGKAYKVNDSFYFAKNGEIYTIGNKKCFVFGGAHSHDKLYRKEGSSWWPQEAPDMGQRNQAIENLAKYNYKVDYIFTHCGPREVVKDKLGFESDDINAFLSFIMNNVEFEKWFMGHYHLNRTFPIDANEKMRRLNLLYNDIVEIDIEED